MSDPSLAVAGKHTRTFLLTFVDREKRVNLLESCGGRSWACGGAARGVICFFLFVCVLAFGKLMFAGGMKGTLGGAA